ncbi:MAG: pyridoxal phosphate-dependent aminotransferase, partial [Candidatus Thermoplasmatota archaeon]|nr:pyridoxal phosphate-dependent aminotransferase [Candidatus Thermoplasmatota archaeon]
INYDEWQVAIRKSHIIMITPISNPSGWDLHPEDKAWIIKQAQENDVIVIADEAYNDAYRNDKDYRSIHTYGNNCISINSLTKVYGMGPIRFGWLISDSETIAIARNIFMTFSGVMSSPTMRIAAEALKNLEIVDQAIEYYRTENLPMLRTVLEKHGIVWNEPNAGVFGCFELPNN